MSISTAYSMDFSVITSLSVGIVVVAVVVVSVDGESLIVVVGGGVIGVAGGCISVVLFVVGLLVSVIRWWLTAHPTIFSMLSALKTCFFNNGVLRFAHSISCAVIINFLDCNSLDTILF